MIDPSSLSRLEALPTVAILMMKNLLKPLKRFFLLSLSLLTVVVILVGGGAIAQYPSPLNIPTMADPEPPEVSQPENLEPPPPALGWEFLGVRTPNQVTLNEVEYFGDCPGEQTATIEARFFSDAIPTARRRRVMVRNITRGLDDDPYPYTDREYEEGRLSEETNMRFGTDHSGRFFHVLPGENIFEYEIKDRREVIDAGQFTATIDRNLRTEDRPATWREDRACANDSVATNVCADLRDRRQLRCPDGRVLETELFPSNATIITAIHNLTGQPINFSVNNRMTQLFPNAYTQLTDDWITIQYQKTDGSFTTERLTRGTRYRFYFSGNVLRFDSYSQSVR
ncbi:hypothetical protein PN441_20690 [Spirulina major CS-329]|uniref:hypothetical protein n=1 Tax=Spirulina TaxID=1154 RepID=UPI0023310B06|nr:MULTISPECIES: hypothetical protein [Spirulina]MDB9494987.1 hypothetical protein [Spirulina subsalsa CS-330]MDB9505503.1 hypothetical protein [Spirulina major CS-329]